MTIDEYNQWFRDAGFEKTGEGTILTEEWVNDAGTYIMVTRAEQLTENERAVAVGRYRMYLGIGYPPGGFGPH